ncbi:MAG: hypothetical protein LVS60_02700 [Nodosilinea sp. LVE1205-7]
MVKRPPSPDTNDSLLSPPLQAGLESLMVNLDEELERYRQGESHRRSRSRLKLRPKDPVSPRLPQFSNPTAANSQALTTPATTTSALGGAPAALGPKNTPKISSPVASGSPSQDLTAYPTATEDYLESTEALLEADPTAYITDYSFSSSSSPAGLGRQLATPLGLGALLLLLLTSAGFGYLVTSPQAIGQLKNHPLVQRLIQSLPQSSPAPSSSTTEAVPPTADTQGQGLQGLGPDLSAQEFGKLDLNRLSNLPSSPSNPVVPNPEPGQPSQPESATSREPLKTSPMAPLPTIPLQQPATASPRSLVESTTPIVRSVSPRVLPRPSQPVVTSSTNLQPPKPLGRPSSSRSPLPPAPLSQAPRPLNSTNRTGPRYYVVANYSGDSSLQAARQSVADAYLRNFPSGLKIQLGAFAQESAARDLIEKLQSQGLAVQLYVAP